MAVASATNEAVKARKLRGAIDAGAPPVLRSLAGLLLLLRRP